MKSKWVSKLCVSVLLVQMAIMPIQASAISEIDDKNDNVYPINKNQQSLEDIKNLIMQPEANESALNDESSKDDSKAVEDTSGDNSKEVEQKVESDLKEPTKDDKEPVNSPDDTNDSGNNQTDGKDEVQEPDEPVSLFDEVPVKTNQFHTYSWSPEIPTDYKKHIALIDSLYATYGKEKTDENAMKLAYAIARLPINADTLDTMRDKATYVEKLYTDIQKQKNPDLENQIYEIVGLLSYDFVILKDFSQDYVLLVNTLDNMKDTPEKEQIKKLKDEYDKTVKPGVVEDKPTGTPGTDDYEGEYDDGITIDNDYIGGIKPEEEPVPTLPEKDYDTSKTSYNPQGNSCTVATQYYKNGKLIRTTNTKATSTDLASCVSLTAQTPHKSKKEIEKIEFTGYNPYDREQRIALLKKLKASQDADDENAIGDLTIQYTFNKYDESPYFIDTGINVLDSKEVTYEQARNALHIISIEAKGQFVEDVDQVLALVDGQIIRIEAYEGLKSFEEFESNFELTNVGVKLQDTRSQTKQELIDLVEIKGVKSIFYNDQEIQLNNDLIVDNNVLLFPSKQLVEAIGGNIIENEEKKQATITINGATFVYTIDSDKALMNNQEIDLSTKIRYNKDGSFMIPMTTILEQAGLELVVNEDKMVIQKIEE